MCGSDEGYNVANVKAGDTVTAMCRYHEYSCSLLCAAEELYTSKDLLKAWLINKGTSCSCFVDEPRL